MSPESSFTLAEVARTVVAHHAVHGTFWVDGPGRTHWIVLWKVPAAREKATVNAEAWSGFKQLMLDLRAADGLPDLDRGWLRSEAGRLQPVVRDLARQHPGGASDGAPLADWELRRAASILGAAYRNLRRRDGSRLPDSTRREGGT